MSRKPVIKNAPIQVSYLRAALITLLSVLLTWSATALSYLINPVSPEIMEAIFWPTVIIATLVPILVSFPVSVVLQRERLKLARAMKQLEAAHAELEQRARIDPLTNTLSREAFLDEMSKIMSNQLSGAMLMLDIDHFKSINDTYGHHAGDEALKEIAAAIRTAVRQNDIVGRIGGEEFGIFVPDADVDQARQMAERIRSAISRIQFFPRPGIARRITASLGVAMRAHDAETSELFRQADRSLYEAKDAGRNCVEVYKAA